MASLVACGDDAPTRSAEPATEVAETARESLSVTAPGPSEDCPHALAEGTPAAVRTTLHDLGYDLLFADACTVQRAEQEGDPAICQELSVSTLRDRCVARVAIASAQPLACPPGRTMPGRDPLCVALAARDRRLCQVASVLDRAVCEQALGRATACAHLPDTERDACTERAADLASRVQGEPTTSPALTTSMTLTLADGSTRSPTSAARGARITYRGCTRVLVLGEQAHLTAPFGLAGVAFEVVVPGEEPFEASLTSLPSETASTLSATLDGSRVLHANTGSVSLTRLTPELGGVVEGTFHASYAGEMAMLDGTFTTFVRDVDLPSAACAPAPAAR